MGVGGGLWWIGDYCVRTKIDYDMWFGVDRC
jgi:hypothetical protein